MRSRGDAQARPGIELGPVVGAVPMFEVGRPSSLVGSLGVGVAAGLESRLPVGAVVGAELRVLDARAGEYHLTRLRGAVLGGYAMVRGRFTMRALAGVTVEPWWTGGPNPTLLGGVLRATPGLRARVGPRLFVHVGVRLELAVSGTSGRAAVGVADGATALFRVGGVELGGGLEVGLAWGLRGR